MRYEVVRDWPVSLNGYEIKVLKEGEIVEDKELNASLIKTGKELKILKEVKGQTAEEKREAERKAAEEKAARERAEAIAELKAEIAGLEAMLANPPADATEQQKADVQQMIAALKEKLQKLEG